VTADPASRGAEALEHLRPGLQLMALRALGNMAAAEEVAQETLTRALVAVQSGQPRDPDKLPAFVTGIARHVIADTCRDRKRTGSLETLPEGAAALSTPDALSTLISSAEQAAVHAALARLSPEDRELMRLAFFDGLTPGDIAHRLGEPAERIRKRKSRALERLRMAFLVAGQGSHEGEGPAT
jgi:RNA polymerase sigma factor (sigma-70 family)